ncbi:MAG: hypothetical protein AB7I27_13260 [Bacteriovoracaceae bacterium]
MKKLISIILSLQFLLMMPVMAQDEGESAPEDDFLKNTQQDVMIVAGAAVAGGVIGLSTLSFVDKPSKHMSNIWTGAAVGMIAGVIFVAYNSAQKGQEELIDESASLDFNSSERADWHFASNSYKNSQINTFEIPFWQKSF